MTESSPLGPESSPLDHFRSQGEITALSHFYRGEVQRSNTWRLRLDHTTNWAVITTGGLISYAFSVPSHAHVVLILTSVIILFFLLIEARRYRYYDVWRFRVRMLEVHFVAFILKGRTAGHQDATWRDDLADELFTPRFKITLLEAFGRRLRRNYIYMYLLIIFAWFAEFGISINEGYGVIEFVEDSRIGGIPGWTVIGVQFLYIGLIFAIAITTLRDRQASGEVISDEERSYRRGVPDDTWF